jgi:hypothetical protein
MMMTRRVLKGKNRELKFINNVMGGVIHIRIGGGLFNQSNAEKSINIT